MPTDRQNLCEQQQHAAQQCVQNRLLAVLEQQLHALLLQVQPAALPLGRTRAPDDARLKKQAS
jgi:hypothetical protein